jgi:hypothetical protein
MPKVERAGPRVYADVVYECRGCCHLRTVTRREHFGEGAIDPREPIALCTAPSIVSEHSVPQALWDGYNPRAPEWCPYRMPDHG